jgi:hypothetical protein
MNRYELYNKKVEEGWKAEPIDTWTLVKDEAGYQEYEVKVALEGGKAGVAIIGIKNPNLTNTEGTNIESAKPIGWKREPVAFDIDLRNFLNEKEAEVSAIFGIRVDNINIGDEVAEVTVYTTSTNDVTSNKYVVVRRNDLFKFKKLV